MALIPVASSLSSVTATSFLVIINADGNPAPPATYYTIKTVFGSTIKYVNAIGNLQDTKTYLPLLSITVNGLIPNTLHSVVLTAANDAIGTGESVEGVAATATTLAAVPVVQGFSNVFATTVMANWGANSNPTGTAYEVEISPDSSFVFNVISSGWITTVGYIFTGILPNTSYFARVKARNSVLVTTSYVLLGGVTTLIGPDTVKVIRVYNLFAERGYLITWQPNQETDIVSYKVYRSGSPTDDAAFELLAMVLKPITSYLDKQPYTFGVVFYYKVTAIDNGGNESSLTLTTPAHENTFHSFEEQPFPVVITTVDMIEDETPQGLINGVNLLYITLHAYRKNELQVFLNGAKMIRGVDYTEGPLSQQFVFADPPDTSDYVRVSYLKY